MNIKFISHIVIKRKLFGIILLAVIILLPFIEDLSYSIYVEIANVVISQNKRGKFLNEHAGYFNRKLNLGMNKSEVENILGKPDNANDQNVWLWLNDLTKYKANNSDMHWEKMIYLHGGLGGIFLIFIDNKLEVKLMNTASFEHPAYVISGLKKISIRDAIKKLNTDNKDFTDYESYRKTEYSGVVKPALREKVQ